MILGYSELDSSCSHTIQLHRKTSVHSPKLSAFVFLGTKKIKQVWNDMWCKQCQNRYYCLNCSSSCPMRVSLSFRVSVHPICTFFLCECLCTAYKLSLDENNPGPPGREWSSERFKGLLIIVTWAVARKRVGGRMTDLFDRVQARLQCAGNCCRTLQLFSGFWEWDPVQTHVQVLLTTLPVCSGCFNNLPLHSHFKRAVSVHFFIGLDSGIFYFLFYGRVLTTIQTLNGYKSIWKSAKDMYLNYYQ